MGRLRVGNMPGGLHIEDVDTVVKVITVGNGAVGKTSLIRRFCEGVFTGVYQKTLAVDFVEKQDFVVPGVEEPVTLHVWDTAGQEEYDAITSGYYRGALGCILCFASDDRKSLNDLEKWKKKVEEECPNIPMIIAQTKMDLMNDNVKDNTNVREVFEGTVTMYHKYMEENRDSCAETKAEETKKAKPAPGVDLDAKPKKKAKKGGCC